MKDKVIRQNFGRGPFKEYLNRRQSPGTQMNIQLPVFHQSNGELLIKEDSETIEKML
jgi:hypothetical protein